jgi:hypothetical protein
MSIMIIAKNFFIQLQDHLLEHQLSTSNFDNLLDSNIKKGDIHFYLVFWNMIEKVIGKWIVNTLVLMLIQWWFKLL